MMNIKLATDNRKETAARLAEITGAESRYTKVPRCAYEVGPYTIEKDGSITVAEDADLAPLQALADEGLVVYGAVYGVFSAVCKHAGSAEFRSFSRGHCT